MSCSRRRGVIYIVLITAISWPTPHHRLRRGLSSRRSLLVSALSNYHQSLCKGSTATQLRPRGTLIADQRRACAARPKGKYSRGRMALAPIRTREFSLPREPLHQPCLPIQIQLPFTSHTGSLLLSSLKKVTFPSFVRPPISRKRLDMSRQIGYHESGHNLLRGSI